MISRRGLFYASAALASYGAPPQRPSLRLESMEAVAEFDLLGGGLVDFHLRDGALNPLTWESNGGETQPRPRGHFLCLDRWGQPSAAEQKNGMPFHGEASQVVWKHTGAGQMEAFLPMAQLRIERLATLSGSELTVRERVTNQGKLGRIYNMVQHPSIAPPFLDEQTFVDASVGRGFAQSNPEQIFETANELGPFRNLATDPNPNVASFVVPGDTGWVTAVSPSKALLVGYVWKTSDYPWLNLWRHVANGRPAARGLEFGTTGLHQPFGEMVRRGGRMLERPLFDYLDAGETRERGYRAFLRKLDPGVTQVSSVRINGANEIQLTF